MVHSLLNPLYERYRPGMDIMLSNPPHKPVFPDKFLEAKCIIKCHYVSQEALNIK